VLFLAGVGCWVWCPFSVFFVAAPGFLPLHCFSGGCFVGTAGIYYMVFVGFFVLLYMCLFLLFFVIVFIFCFSSVCCFCWVYIYAGLFGFFCWMCWVYEFYVGGCVFGFFVGLLICTEQWVGIDVWGFMLSCALLFWRECWFLFSLVSIIFVFLITSLEFSWFCPCYRCF